MFHSVSDEDSIDSESGIRFKTTNTRNKSENIYNKECSKIEGSSNLCSSKKSISKKDDREKYNRYRHKRSNSSSSEYSKTKPNNYNDSIAKYKSSKTPTSSTNQIAEKYDKYKRNIKSVKAKNKEHSNETLKYDDSLKECGESSNIEHYGPSLPSKRMCEDNYADVYGPAIPEYLKPKQETDTKKQINPSILPSSSKCILANKPSDSSTKEENKILGPVLPPHLRNLLLENADNAQNVVESDDEMIGPLPPGQSSNNSGFVKLEERALLLKIEGFNKTGKEEGIVREEWMLELPEVHSANLGLGPRQFRAKGVPDMSDRSSWTDTPQNKKDKTKKVDLKKETELRQIKSRDQEQEAIIAKTKKKRDKSLIDIHQAKLEEKKVIIK